jgi:hypothetical protein
MREKEREERRSGRKARSLLGMTSTTATMTTTTTDATPAADGIPVTTPNGPDAGHSVNTPTTKRSLDFQGVADDASVLPVPSHVVLHHLTTSAIRNGVLAVGNTTRYKKKVRRSLADSLVSVGIT